MPTLTYVYKDIHTYVCIQKIVGHRAQYFQVPVCAVRVLHLPLHRNGLRYRNLPHIPARLLHAVHTILYGTYHSVCMYVCICIYSLGHNQSLFILQNLLFYALFSTFERKNGALIMTQTISVNIYLFIGNSMYCMYVL